MTNKSQVINTTNLPMYSIQTFLKNYILVAGGGGSSKTGIANGFEVFKLNREGKTISTTRVIRHDSGPNAIMNCCVSISGNKIYIAANEDDKCRLYIADIIIEPTFVDGKVSKEINYKITTGGSIRTDFNSEDEPQQRIVKINNDGNLMVTGGTDGCIRLWNFPIVKSNEINPLKTYEGHTKEIDDIDISPDGKFIVSVAKDGKAYHWNTVTNVRSALVHPINDKQIFKRCKFGVTGNKLIHYIYTIANGPKQKSGQKSYLQSWSEKNTILYELAFSEPTSALSVRKDGFYIAVGTMFSGSVSIHEANNLKIIYNVKQAHAMFVTGLEFLDESLMPNTKAAVLSISVDNRVCFHNVPSFKVIPFWKMLFIIHIILLLFYCILFVF